MQPRSQGAALSLLAARADTKKLKPVRNFGVAVGGGDAALEFFGEAFFEFDDV